MDGAGGAMAGNSRPYAGGSSMSSGIQTAGFSIMVEISVPLLQLTTTENYNGSNLVNRTLQLASSTNYFTGGGSPSGTDTGTALATAGGSAPYAKTTEKFNVSIYSPIAATWASTTSTPSPSAYSSGASGGTPTAGFMAGGFFST